MFVTGTTTLTGKGAGAVAIQVDRNNKQVIFKNSELFIECTTEINITQIDDAKHLHVVLPMYNLQEYSDNY